MPIPRTSDADAQAELRAAGYEPLEPYPGLVQNSWNVRCLTCRTERRVRLNGIRQGRRCAHRGTRHKAYRLLEIAALRAVEPYPGSKTQWWGTRCLSCLKPHTIRLCDLPKRGWWCDCVEREQKARAAEAELRRAGYEPLAPYPGIARKPWPSRCLTCRQERRPSLMTIRAGKRCQHQTPEELGRAVGSRSP